jgi:hypothetical protein
VIFDEIPAFATLLKIAKRLRELNISYAVGGEMAMFFHGLECSADVLELLVSRESLGEIHQRATGLEFISSTAYGSKDILDRANGVTVKFLVAADYPGDGRRKPVAYPDPIEASDEKDGIRWMKLPVLIEIKLASGMTNPAKAKDLDDVRNLIDELNLDANYGQNLNEYVRDKFEELVLAVEKGS